MNHTQNSPTYKILIIEDEPKVSSFIKKGLETNLFEADIATNGLDGRDMTLSKCYDLVLLDINLPILNGFEVCRQIKAVTPGLPIVMLTARGTTEDMAKAQSCGADAYIVKPFEFKELVKVIHAFFNVVQSGNKESGKIRIADLELNIQTKSVKRNNQEISVSKKEFELLYYLAKHTGKPVPLVELEKNIFDTSDTDKKHVHLFMRILQKKIDSIYSPKLLHIVEGFGYTLYPL